MHREYEVHDAPAWCSDGQKWLYRLMSNYYGQAGAAYAIPAPEISGLIEYGAAASQETDQDIWRAAAHEVCGWYEGREARVSADQYFRQLGLVPVLAAIDSQPAANN